MLAFALKGGLEQLGAKVLVTDRELDVSDADQVMTYAATHRPRAILNGAAYTRVDDAEKNSEEAMRTNGVAVLHLARAARELGCPLIHFSTDYVFDGKAGSPYPEDAATAPASAYGKSKLLGEQHALEVLGGESCYVIRTSWLYGPKGANFVKTMLGLMREREELRVVEDQLGRPTYTDDLARASLDLVGLSGRRPAPAGIYHFANAGETSWHGFAVRILAIARDLGFKLKTERVLPCSTADYPRPAPRPAYSVLDTTRIERALGRAPRAWPDALCEYLTLELVSQGKPS